MNNRVLVAGLIGGIASLFLGFLIWAVLLESMLAENTMQGVMRAEGEMNWAFLIIGSLAYGFLLAYILDKANAVTFGSGATIGAVVGLLSSLASGFISYAVSNWYTTMTGPFLDIIGAIVMFALVGGIVGWWYGRGRTVVVTDTTRRV